VLPVPAWTLAVRPRPSSVVVVKWLEPPLFVVVAVTVHAPVVTPATSAPPRPHRDTAGGCAASRAAAANKICRAATL
jgi:hypothetical protein